MFKNVDTTSVALAVAAIVVMYFVYYYSASSGPVTGIVNMNEETVISPAQLTTGDPNSGNFTYSIWFQIDDWSDFYTKNINLFQRDPSPKVSFDGTTNAINVVIASYSSSSGSHTENQVTVKNFPLQSWNHLLISVYGSTLDVYMNGKLVNTKILDNVAEIYPNTNVNISQADNDVKGKTASFRYYDRALNPQQVYNVYTRGYGGNVLRTFLGNFGVKLAFLENGEETSAITF